MDRGRGDGDHDRGILVLPKCDDYDRPARDVLEFDLWPLVFQYHGRIETLPHERPRRRQDRRGERDGPRRVTDAGSGAIITSAERTKLSGIETGAEVNVVTTNLGSANQVLGSARTIFFDGSDLMFKTGDGTGTSITELHYDADGAQGTGIFTFGARVEFQDVVNFRGAGGTSQSQDPRRSSNLRWEVVRPSSSRAPPRTYPRT